MTTEQNAKAAVLDFKATILAGILDFMMNGGGVTIARMARNVKAPNVTGVAHYLGITEALAADVMATAITDGLIEIGVYGTHYDVTSAGMAVLRANPPLPRPYGRS